MIPVKSRIFCTYLFDKWDGFQLSIVRMLYVNSDISS